MTDGERIEKLTQLAMLVWPGAAVGHTAGYGRQPVKAYVELENSLGGNLVSITHPTRSLDALEAALCVLAELPPSTEAQLSKISDVLANWRNRENDLDSCHSALNAICYVLGEAYR